MRRRIHVLLAALMAVGLATAAAASHHEMQVKKVGEVLYLSGGVGDAEQKALAKRAEDFNLELQFARPDGAYLASVDVEIRDRRAGKTVLDVTSGPILLVNLPAGEYSVHATLEGHEKEQRTTSIVGGDRVKMVLELPAT
jgi:hypothetical protein